MLPGGTTLSFELDIASLYKLSADGAYTVASRGIIPYAAEESTFISGVLLYQSNTLSIDVNVAAASREQKVLHVMERREVIEPDCNATQRSVLRSALANCALLSTIAANAAVNGSAPKY
jgi:deuterolysin